MPRCTGPTRRAEVTFLHKNHPAEHAEAMWVRAANPALGRIHQVGYLHRSPFPQPPYTLMGMKTHKREKPQYYNEAEA